MQTWIFPVFATVIILLFVAAGIWAYWYTKNNKRKYKNDEFKDKKEKDDGQI